MTTVISGDTGVNQIQDGAVSSTAKIAAGAVAAADCVAGVALTGGQSGSAPLYGARAWCNADGTLAGTNAPRAGGNVASVTRNAVGDYTITFTTAMPDTNYAVVGVSNGFSVVEDNNAIRTAARTTTSVQIRVLNGIATAYVDTASLQVVIFR